VQRGARATLHRVRGGPLVRLAPQHAGDQFL